MAIEQKLIITEEHLKKCRTDCKFYKQDVVFELCCTEESQYLDNNAKQQLHTIRHMRFYDCGPDGRHYRRKF